MTDKQSAARWYHGHLALIGLALFLVAAGRFLMIKAIDDDVEETAVFASANDITDDLNLHCTARRHS